MRSAHLSGGRGRRLLSTIEKSALQPASRGTVRVLLQTRDSLTSLRAVSPEYLAPLHAKAKFLPAPEEDGKGELLGKAPPR